jgi:hypothetical protein
MVISTKQAEAMACKNKKLLVERLEKRIDDTIRKQAGRGKPWIDLQLVDTDSSRLFNEYLAHKYRENGWHVQVGWGSITLRPKEGE